MISQEETREMLYHEPLRKMKREEMEKLQGADLMDLKDTQHTFADNRPDWDSWFLTLCFVVSQRSLDKDTKHGCVAVDSSRSILSTGYNSPPRGCADAFVPLERPAKYDYMMHSEANAIANAARTGTCLRDSIFYITGPPCHKCLGDMINAGVKKIIHGPTPSVMLTAEIDKVSDFFKMNQNIEIVEIKEIAPVLLLLSKTEEYIDSKMGSKNEEKKS